MLDTKTRENRASRLPQQGLFGPQRAVLALVVSATMLPIDSSQAAITPSGDVSPAYPGIVDPWNVGGELTVGNTAAGSLVIDLGSQVNSDGGTLAFESHAPAQVEITGVGSQWINTQNTDVGVFGNATLEIRQGGVVANSSASIGKLIGEGDVLVQDPGSLWNTTSNLFVGNAGHGDLVIADGGRVVSQAAWVGFNTGATGTVMLQGTDSRWEAKQLLLLGDVSDAGSGTVTAQSGGNRIYVGASAPNHDLTLPSTETATIVSDATIVPELGIYNASTLEITGNSYVGFAAGESGRVVVSGTGSTWDNTGTIQIGFQGTGTLVLAADGKIIATGGLSIGTSGDAQGNGMIEADVTNNGSLSPGDSVGTIEIIGNYLQSASGSLEAELMGSAQGEYDILAISGTASLDGTLSVSLLPEVSPFEPQLGESFQLLTATGGISGTFNNLSLPILATGLMWRVGIDSHAIALSVELAGDYNRDGVVNAADYAIWLAALGAGQALDGDGNNDGAVDVLDYLFWKQNVGLTASSLIGGTADVAAPEPASGSLLAAVLIWAVISTQRVYY